MKNIPTNLEESQIIKNTVNIRWIQTNLSKLDEHENHYFYAFSRGNVLLYLGKSHKTLLKEEIKQSLKRLKISSIGLSIWVGWLFKHDTTHQTEVEITDNNLIDSKLVDDAESLLIYRNKTFFNDKKTKSYRGIIPLTVFSKGCYFLKEKISIVSKKGSVKNKKKSKSLIKKSNVSKATL